MRSQHGPANTPGDFGNGLLARSEAVPRAESGEPAPSSSSGSPRAGGFPAPLLVLAAAFWSGIALSASLFPKQEASPLGFAAAGALLAAACLLSGTFPRFRPDAPPPPFRGGAATAALVAAAFAAGFPSRPEPGSASSLAAAARALGADRLRRPVRLEGELLGEPEDFGSRTVLRLRVDRLAANRKEWAVAGEARTTVHGSRAHLRGLARGARISVWARVAEPRPPGNPGAREGWEPVALFGSAKSGLLVRELEAGPAFWRAVRSIRIGVRNRLLESGLPPPAAAVAAAMLIGDRTLARPETERAFRDAGTLHLMAVSGLHVGIVSFLFYGAAVLFGARRRTAFTLLLGVLPLYAALSGGRPSVMRAVLMAGVLIIGMRRGLFGTAMNGLGFAALLLLAHSPGNALDAGFQLSFAATLTILAAFRPRDPAEVSWERPPRWRAFLIGPLLVTLAAQLATFPIIAWHFGRVVFGGLLVAVPAALLAGPVLGIGFGWIVLGGIPLLGDGLLFGLRQTAEAIISLSEWGASLPFGAFPVSRPGLAWLLAWLALTVFVLAARFRRDPATDRRLPQVLAAGLLVLLALSRLPWRDPADGTLRLTALDVGQGDALVLALPDGGAVLVDAGTAFDGWSAGESVVIPFLAERGHRRLRAAVASHGDLDHIGGFSAVFRDFAVDEVWESAGTAEDGRRTVERFRRERRRRAIPLRRLRSGERFTLGGAEFRVLSAGERAPEGADRPNERSLILVVEFAGRRILLTGDAGSASERMLLDRYRGSLRADVLKVGHHGSRSSTSAAFLSAVAPRIALVSARADERRRLPDEGVLERLAASGARVYRTDHSGAITVEIAPDGSLTVKTFHDRQRPPPAARPQ